MRRKFLTLDEVKRRHVAATFKALGGNVSQTAALLGLHRSSLQRMLQKYGLKPFPEKT